MEVGSGKAEVGGRKAEGLRQRTENRSRNADCGMRIVDCGSGKIDCGLQNADLDKRFQLLQILLKRQSEPTPPKRLRRPRASPPFDIRYSQSAGEGFDILRFCSSLFGSALCAQPYAHSVSQLLTFPSSQLLSFSASHLRIFLASPVPRSNQQVTSNQ